MHPPGSKSFGFPDRHAMRYEARLWSQCSADPRAARPSSHGPRSLAKCTEGYRQSARGPSVSCVASHAVSADVSESVWPGQGLKCAVLWGAMLFCAGHRIVREIEQFGSDSHLGPIAMHTSANAKPCWAPAAVDRAVKGQHYFPRQPENAIVHLLCRLPVILDSGLELRRPVSFVSRREVPLPPHMAPWVLDLHGWVKSSSAKI